MTVSADEAVLQRLGPDWELVDETKPAEKVAAKKSQPKPDEK